MTARSRSVRTFPAGATIVSMPSAGFRGRSNPAGQATTQPTYTPAGTYNLPGTITLPDGSIAQPGATAETDGYGNVTIRDVNGNTLYSGPESGLQISGAPTTPATTTTATPTVPVPVTTSPQPFPWGWFLGGAALGILGTGIAFHAMWKIPFGKLPTA